MLEAFLAVFTRIAVALEILASNKDSAPATLSETTKDKATSEAEKSAAQTGETTTGAKGAAGGRRSRAATAAANAEKTAEDAGSDASKGAGSVASTAGGRRTRARSTETTTPVEDTAEIKAAREDLLAIGIDFSQYPDLTKWVQDELKKLGVSDITQIAGDKVLDTLTTWQEKETEVFGAE